MRIRAPSPLHERVVFLTVEFRELPWVSAEERVTCEALAAGCWRVRARYGFMVPVSRPDGMALWRERLFAAMARNAGNVSAFFNIPDNRVIELGTRVQL